MFGKKKSLDVGPSLRDPSGAFMLCPTCGRRLIGYGDTGGYCEACYQWAIDSKLISSRFKKYGKVCETLCVLIAYENVRNMYGMFDDMYGTLLVTPFSLMFRPESKAAAIKRGNGKLRRPPEINETAMISPFNDISDCQAYGGRCQVMNIYFNKDPGCKQISCGYAFEGTNSYDGAEGEDFKRLKQLIMSLIAHSNI